MPIFGPGDPADFTRRGPWPIFGSDGRLHLELRRERGPGEVEMAVTEGELLVCTVVWIAGAGMVLVAVWLILSYKKRCLRRRQRQYRENFNATYGDRPRRRNIKL